MHAAKAAAIHLMLSIVVALGVAVFVFGIWYPFPYREMSGGRELFLLVIAVDIVCGPILTLVLFDKSKHSVELWRDLCLVALMQLAALGYGLWSVYEARPLYFVLEIDRFKVIAAPDLRPAALKELALLPPSLKPTPGRSSQYEHGTLVFAGVRAAQRCTQLSDAAPAPLPGG